MPNVTRQMHRGGNTSYKLENQRVFISGFIGHHPLDVGITYWYRGHYIYAFPMGNLIEPVPFSTRQGVTINGIIQEQAPKYDPHAAGSVLEVSVAALDKSKANEWARQQEENDEKRKEAAEVVELEKNVEDLTGNNASSIPAEVGGAEVSDLWPKYACSRVASDTVLPSLLQSSSRTGSHVPLTDLGHKFIATTTAPKVTVIQAPSMPSLTACAPQITPFGPVFTPHNHAKFLATSAPGSHSTPLVNTPYTSNPVSPTPDHRSRGTPRPISSVPRSTSLIAEEGIRRAFKSFENVTEGKISSDAYRRCRS